MRLGWSLGEETSGNEDSRIIAFGTGRTFGTIAITSIRTP